MGVEGIIKRDQLAGAAGAPDRDQRLLHSQPGF